ncbi:hypothetical protein MGYG_08342 [Nannizzia gypsea CBS 118893]|uniref:Uncharacterized protein n=1 Tax=Arthroderma gypseum (strain ATCC MYA-4604 / CBS 118893) TaxID=535722 RepID=E4V5F6_ARTGP|nr:hypothetical protein MGYG_08342 [Nannizzia gypsea CBS 118893]EFR05331.1 hypothetical protein MGYG_08342 [Nannizzia gypsea CBS 118893]
MRPGDPRIRQTINQISQNLESANESAQEGIYAFAHHYIEPCFLSVQECFTSCTAPCFPSRDDQLRRRRRERSNGRAEFTFGFYDDWDYDEDAREDGLLGWRNDELDRLLAGSSSARTSNDQPRMNRRMSYGARRRGSILPSDERQDPTVIPSSSILGFLERFPWRIGARGIRYRPSAANLQDNPGGLKRDVQEQAPLLEASDESDHSGGGNKDSNQNYKAEFHPRKRRVTKREDAVPLDDEINIMTLGRRRSSLGGGDESVFSIPHSISASTKETPSSQASRTSKGKGKRRRRDRDSKRRHSSIMIEPAVDGASLTDLKREEDEARLEEEKPIERSRLAARDLARENGLKLTDSATEPPITALKHHQPTSPFSNSQPHTPVSVSQSGQPDQGPNATIAADNPEPEPHSPKPLDTKSSDP